MHQLYFKNPGTLWNQMIPVKVKRDKLIYIYLMMAELKHSEPKSSRFCSLKVNMRYIYNKGKSGESSNVVKMSITSIQKLPS